MGFAQPADARRQAGAASLRPAAAEASRRKAEIRQEAARRGRVVFAAVSEEVVSVR